MRDIPGQKTCTKHLEGVVHHYEDEECPWCAGSAVKDIIGQVQDAFGLGTANDVEEKGDTDNDPPELP